MSSGQAGGDAVAAAQARRVLVYVWDRCMRLLHPFMPFLTETLWQLTPHTGTSIMLADWPVPRDTTEPLAMDPNAVATFEALQTLVRAVRNARAEYNVEPGKKVAALVRASPAFKEAVEGEAAALVLLGRLDAGLLQVIGFDDAPPSEQAVHLVIADGLDVWLPMSGLVDTEKERARLTKQADKLKIIQNYDRIIRHLKKQGTIKKIFERYFGKGNYSL